MANRTILVIGIDGLDPILLSKWKSDLPNFRNLIENEPKIELTSTYPVDSVPVWASIYTGLTPANHGILHEMDYFNHIQNNKYIESSFLSGKTFWDFAGKHGKKVCIINPFLAYPPWKVNGIMVSGPVFSRGNSLAYPDHIFDKHNPPHLGGIVERYPSRNELSGFYEKLEKITRDRSRFALEMLQDCEWDLAFVCFIALDGIEHFFWRYFDEQDPTYPGITSYKNTIKNFYILFDEILGRFFALDPKTIIVLSDHGHGMRNTKLVNINRVLMENNVLTANSVKATVHGRIISKSIGLIRRNSILHYLSGKIIRKFPRVRTLKTSGINLEKSQAYVLELGGRKPFGGVCISANIKDSDYESFRKYLIEKIRDIKDPETGEELIKWICKREELYKGIYENKYPDIVFELKDPYGINWDIHDELISFNKSHEIISGGHKRKAVFLINSKSNRSISRKSITSVDIAPTILSLLNIKDDFGLDGSSIFESK